MSPAGPAWLSSAVARWLILSLAGSCLLTGALFAGFDEGPYHRWLNVVIAVQIGGGALVLLTVWSWRNVRPGRTWLVLVILAGVTFRLAAMPASRDLSDDAYRYHWDGKAVASGINPYLYAPDDDEVAHLHIHAVDDKINHPWYRTCYPPVAELLFAAGYRLSPGRLRGLQLLQLAAELAAWLLLIGALRCRNLPITTLLIAVWSPLVIFQGYLPGHLDVLYLPLLVLLVVLIERGHGRRAGVILGVAALIKPLPLFFLPAAWRELGPRRSLQLVLALAVVVGLFYLPFRSAGLKLFESTWLMAREWSFNGGVAALFEQWWPRQTAHYVSGGLLALMIGLAVWRGRDLLARMLLIQAAFVVCTPTLFPWYLIGMYVLLVLRPDPALLALFILIPVADEVLVGYHASGIWNPAGWVKWVEYVPFYTLLLVSAWRGWGMFSGPRTDREKSGR